MLMKIPEDLFNAAEGRMIHAETSGHSDQDKTAGRPLVYRLTAGNE